MLPLFSPGCLYDTTHPSEARADRLMLSSSKSLTLSCWPFAADGVAFRISTFRYHYPFDVSPGFFRPSHGFSGLGLSRFLGFLHLHRLHFLVHQGFSSSVKLVTSLRTSFSRSRIRYFLGSRGRHWHSYPTCRLHAPRLIDSLKVEMGGPDSVSLYTCFYTPLFFSSVAYTSQAAALYLVNLCHYQFRPQKKLHVCMLSHSFLPQILSSSAFPFPFSHRIFPAHLLTLTHPPSVGVVTTQILDFHNLPQDCHRLEENHQDKTLDASVSTG